MSSMTENCAKRQKTERWSEEFARLKTAKENMMLSVFTRYMSSTPVRFHITKTLRPVLLVKNKDIINYFERPDVLLEIPTVHYIKKDEIINVTKDFKKFKEITSKEFADLSIKKDSFICQKDAKKRLLIVTAKLDKPSSNQDDFDTHAIVEEYELKPIEGIKPPNVEFESNKHGSVAN